MTGSGSLTVVVRLQQAEALSPAVCGAAQLAETEILVYDPFPGEEKPRWLPNGVTYLPRPKAVPLYLWQARVGNEAIENARGEIVLFAGEDVMLTADILARHVAAQNAAGGALVVTPVAGQRINPAYALSEAWVERVAPWALIGDCWSAPAAALRAGGGFDPLSSTATRGDEDVAWRLWSGGLPVVYDRAIRLDREQRTPYPGSRWRGMPHQLLSCRYDGKYVRAWDRVCRLQEAIVDHNRYHNRRAIAGHTLLDGWRRMLIGKRPRSTAAVAVYSEDDVVRAMQLVAEKHELLLLDRSPAAVSHLVAARGAAGQVRVIRDWIVLAAGQLAALDLRLSKQVPPAGGEHLLTAIREAVRRKRDRLLAAWPGWLASVVDGDSVAITPLPDSPRPVPASVRLVSHAKALWQWGPFEEGYAGPPRAVAIRITNRCNMRCVMCGQHGPAGNLAGAGGEELPLSALLPVLKDAAACRAGMLYVWGGEPLLRPDCIDLLVAASRAGLFTVLTTNGYYLREVAADLASIPLCSLRLSLDGPPAIHDQIRGVPGLFQRVVDGVRELERQKKMRGQSLPAVEVECTISPHNYEYLEQMVAIASTLEAHALNFSQLVYADPGQGRQRDRLFRRLFGRPAWTWRGFMLDVDMDYEKLAATLERLGQPGQPLPVNLTPSLSTPAAVRLHYRQPQALYRRKHCCAPWIWVEVHPDGDVYFCDDFHDLAVGNIAVNRLPDIYNGERARHYRRELLARGRFPGCITCGLLNMDGVY